MLDQRGIAVRIGHHCNQPLHDKLGVPVSESEAQTLAVSVPDWPAFGDSTDALKRLGRRFKLIILSNVDRGSFAGSNKRLGVTFTSIITAQDVGSYKPSRRNFDALEAETRRLGIAEGKGLRGAHRRGPQAGRRPGTAAARGAKPLPRSRPRQAGRAAHRLDQPPLRQPGLGCHPRAAGRCHTRLDVLLDGRIRGRVRG